VSSDVNTPIPRSNRGFRYSGVKNIYHNKNTCTSVAQMDATDFEEAEQVTQQATTTFFDEGSMEVGVSSRPTYELSTYVETYADIKAFLMRPVLIANGQWTTAQAQNTNLNSGSISSLLTSVTMWQEKVKGFNLIRGDFMIKIQINASPFHQGKLLLHYLPAYKQFVAVNPRYGKFKNAHLTQKIQHPHVEIDCRKTSVVMKIPYIAPTAFYAFKENYYDWGTWFLDVFSPLFTGAAAPVSQLYVDYLVYAWFENVELQAPTVPQMSNKEIVSKKARRRGGEVNETKENSGPIAMGLKTTAKVAGVLKGIPVLSEIAQPVEWATNILGSVASALGWSKPRELTGTTVVAQQLLRYGSTADGPDLAFPGGMSCLNKLETIDYGSFTTEDEMSLAYLYSVPYYVKDVSWNSTQGQGFSLLSQKISPLTLNGAGLNTGTDVVATHTAVYEYNVPFTYLSKMHWFWRGGIIMTLKFVKTQMHSGRIQVTWVPCNVPTTAPGLVTGAFQKRAVIDIRTEDTISIELPYLLYSDYAETFPGVPNNQFSGQVDIQVLNDLRAPESCSQSINMQVFFSAAEDFELAVPGQFQGGNAPYVPQSDGSELIRESIQQGMTFTQTEIGGSNTVEDKLFHSKRCIGERILSLKQLLLRLSVINTQSFSGFTWTGVNKVTIDPYFITAWQIDGVSGNPVSSGFCGDLFSHVAPWFSFMRGGMRYMIADTSNTTRIMTNSFPGSGFFTTNPYNTGTTTRANYFQAISLASPDQVAPLVPCNMHENYPYSYQHIPYYSRLPMALTSFYNGADSPWNDPGRPRSQLVYTNKPGFTADVVFQRAVADDFQAMFFTGCPPICISYT